MTQQEILTRLRGYPAFQKWTPKDLEDLARRMELLKRRKGEAIFQPETRAEDGFVVAKGQVSQAVVDDQGNAWWTRTISPGEMFGVQLELPSGAYRSTATAKADCEVYRIRARDLAWAFDKDPELRTALQRPDVATRLRAMPLLRSLTDAQIRELAKDVRIREVAAGQAIGDPDGSGAPDKAEIGLWLIDWGQVETGKRHRIALDTSGAVTALPEQGSEKTPRPCLTAGNWFCTGKVKIRNQQIVQARAKTPARLLLVPEAQAEQLVYLHPDVEQLLDQPPAIEEILAQQLRPETLRKDVFAGLSQEHWRDLAGYTGWEHVPRGFAVTIQGDQSDALYILWDGEAVVQATDDQGRERPSQVVSPHHTYGDGALLVKERSDATVRAVKGPSRSGALVDGSDWLVLHRADLLYMIEANPALWAKTRLRTELTRAPERRKHKWQEEEETELYFDRRHWIVLVRWLAPLLLMLGAAALLLWIELSEGGPPNRLLVVAAAGAAAVAALMIPLAVWNYLDDYYAITDRRVVHRQRVLLVYDTQTEAPMRSIQDTTVDRDLLGNLLNYGNLLIQTAAEQGSIWFNTVPEPDRVQSIISEQIRRQGAGLQAVRVESLRQAIIKDLKLRLYAFRPAQVLPAALTVPKEGWLERLRRRRPRRLRSAAQPGQTVYRKHWIFLLRRTILPLLALAISTWIALAAWSGAVPSAESTLALRCGIWLLPLVSAFLVWYQYENWHNDEYILTDSHIVDVEASPFRLSETRRQADWDKVQNVNYQMKGLVARVLNYGTVIIQTAAAVGKFDFVNVGNPRKVQQEIFRRLENHRSRRDDELVRRQQEQFRVALRTYDELMVEDEWPSRS